MQTIEQTIDIAGTPSNILTALTTQNGVAGWWTDDCDVSGAGEPFTRPAA